MEIIKINHKNPNSAIEKIADMIKDDKVAIFPTDTVCGLICDATNKKAIKKIFKIKKRPEGKPISIFVKDIKMAKKFVRINKNQETFLRGVWPGAVTVVLKPKKFFPNNISSGKNTIGVRVPDYKLIFGLIKKINQPLAESSANISGKPASTKIKEVLNQFRKKKILPDVVLNAGNLKPSRPSTVIDLTGQKPRILRT